MLIFHHVSPLIALAKRKMKKEDESGIMREERNVPMIQNNNTLFLQNISESCHSRGVAIKAQRAYRVIPYEMKCSETL